MEFNAAPGLRIEDDFILYKKHRFQIAEIDGIEFAAIVTKHSTNFVPSGTSYDVDLFIHSKGSKIKIKPKTSLFGNLKEENFREMQKVSAVLSHITFNNRVELYERQIRARGYFEFDGCKFYKDGKVINKKNILITDFSQKPRTHSVQLSVYHVTFSKNDKSITDRLKNAWSGEEVVMISYNRDCFIFLMKHILGLSWKNEPVPEKNMDYRKTFLTAVCRMGAKLAKADGVVEKEEIHALKQFFQIDFKSFLEAPDIMKSEFRANSSVSTILSDFKRCFSDDHELLESFIFGMCLVSGSDGEFDKSEISLIRDAGAYLGLDKSQIDRAFYAAGYEPEVTHQVTEFLKYYKILGLTETATVEEIKKAFRGLANRHHPDKLTASGLSEREVKDATRIFVEIRNAYDVLMASHA